MDFQSKKPAGFETFYTTPTTMNNKKCQAPKLTKKMLQVILLCFERNTFPHVLEPQPYKAYCMILYTHFAKNFTEGPVEHNSVGVFYHLIDSLYVLQVKYIL